MIHRDRSAGPLVTIGAALFVAVIVLTPWPVRTATVPIIEPVLETALVRRVTPPAASQAQPAPSAVRRSRIVRVNSYPLPTPGTDARRNEDDLELALFPGVTVRAVFDRFETIGTSGTWVGHIDGRPLSSVALAYRGGLMTGNINTLEAAYQISPAIDVTARDGDPRPLHVVSEIDVEALPNGSDIAEGPASPGIPALAAAQGLDSGDVIDVMVLYTPGAMAQAGGTAGVQNAVALQVAETNAAYANSRINQRIRLVYTGLVNYADSPNFALMLSDLTLGRGGFSGVRALRDAVGADLVAVEVQLLNNATACGIANLAAFPGRGEASGYSVIGDACRSVYVMAHEFGHNMGSVHDWYVEDFGTPWPHGHGHIDTVGQWRTIMAYDDLCRANGFNCPRIPYFSTPDFEYIPFCTGNTAFNCDLLRYWFYPGRPLGVRDRTGCAVGVLPAEPCAADNRRLFSETASTVANFRQSR